MLISDGFASSSFQSQVFLRLRCVIVPAMALRNANLYQRWACDRSQGCDGFEKRSPDRIDPETGFNGIVLQVMQQVGLHKD